MILRKTSPDGFSAALAAFNEAEQHLGEFRASGDKPIVLNPDSISGSYVYIQVKPYTSLGGLFAGKITGPYELEMREEL